MLQIQDSVMENVNHIIMTTIKQEISEKLISSVSSAITHKLPELIQVAIDEQEK